MDFWGKFNQKWISKITDNFNSDRDVYFVDEGTFLPFPLKKWKHIHRIEKINEFSSYIIDDIEFSCHNELIDLAIYPFLYLIFLYRGPVYKRKFNV